MNKFLTQINEQINEWIKLKPMQITFSFFQSFNFPLFFLLVDQLFDLSRKMVADVQNAPQIPRTPTLVERYGCYLKEAPLCTRKEMVIYY